MAAGKIRYVGLSNFLGYQIQKYVDLAGALSLGSRPVAVQPQYNLLARAIEWEVVPACQAEGLGLLPWSPLASGWLTGKYQRDEPPPAGTRLAEQADEGMRTWNERGYLEHNWRVIDAVRKVADGRGVPMSQVAIAWVLAGLPVQLGHPRHPHAGPAQRQPRGGGADAVRRGDRAA